MGNVIDLARKKLEKACAKADDATLKEMEQVAWRSLLNAKGNDLLRWSQVVNIIAMEQAERAARNKPKL